MTAFDSSSPSNNKSIIPVFMGKADRDITFLLDCSEAMGTVLGSVKKLLIQTLLTKASMRDSLLNIISFSYKVTAWWPHMTACAPDTVYEAIGWIHTLSTSPGRDLLTAFGTAFADPACQAVHLVTNGLPENPEQCLAALSAMRTRPVHIFYLSDQITLNSRTWDFLHCITHATRGSCHVVSFSPESQVGQIVPLSFTDSQIQIPSDHLRSVNTCCPLGMTLNPVSCRIPGQTLCFCPYWCSVGNPFSPMVSCASWRAVGTTTFYPGCRVLSRREADGFHYLGTIKHPVQGQRGIFVVEFDKPGYNGETSLGDIPSYQLTCRPDMVNISHAHGHSLVPGDCVLAPWEPELRRYGPGRVIAGMERRDPLNVGDGNGLQVIFWNGIQTLVPKDLAVWIPASYHERIIRELQHHASRQYCQEAPRCDISSWHPPCQCCVHGWPTSYTLCHCPHMCKWSHSLQPLTNSQREEGFLEEKADLQLKGLQSTCDTKALLHCSSSSSSEEDEDGDTNEKPKSTESLLVSRSVNTDISCLQKILSEPKNKPPWKYWRRSTPEPQHRQPGKTVICPKISCSLPMKNKFPLHPAISPKSTNHSALFEMVTESAEQRVTVRDIFGLREQRSSPKMAF